MNKKIITFILVASNLHASPILVIGEGANQVDFIRFKEKNQNPTFLEEEVKRLQKYASEFHIRDQFINGKSALLKGKTEAAKSIFFDLVSKSQKADWNEMDHALITYAFINLAEVSQSSSEKKFWLAKALTFSLGEIPEFGSLSRVAQEMIYEIKKSSGMSLDLPESFFRDWEKILINGKEVTLSSLRKIKIIPDSYRLTLLSNRQLTQTLTLHSNQLETLTVEKNLIAFGSCENPQLHSRIDNKRKYLVFFSRDCDRIWNNGWDISEKLKFLPDYRLTNQVEMPKERDSIFKSKWFWGGVILVGAILLASQSSEPSSPTTSAAPPQSLSNEED